MWMCRLARQELRVTPFFFCKQKTAYEMRISDWSSDVCSSDLAEAADQRHRLGRLRAEAVRECDGIIAADDRAEIAARGELVVQAAIGDEESLAMALLAVDRKSTRLNSSH